MRAERGPSGTGHDTAEAAPRPRLSKSVPANGEPVYRHENGWLIVRQTDDGPRSAVGVIRGASCSYVGPKRWWVVIPSNYTRFSDALRYGRYTFELLRDARKWCDENPRETQDA